MGRAIRSVFERKGWRPPEKFMQPNALAILRVAQETRSLAQWTGVDSAPGFLGKQQHGEDGAGNSYFLTWWQNAAAFRTWLEKAPSPQSIATLLVLEEVVRPAGSVAPLVTPLLDEYLRQTPSMFVIVAGLDGSIRTVTPAFEAQMGMTAAQLRDTPVWDLLAHADSLLLRASLDQVRLHPARGRILHFIDSRGRPLSVTCFLARVDDEFVLIGESLVQPEPGVQRRVMEMNARVAEIVRDFSVHTQALEYAMARLDADIRKVNESFAEVSGALKYVPVCMSCHRVKVGPDEWREVPVLYEFPRLLSHGYCPDCLRLLHDRLAFPLDDAEPLPAERFDFERRIALAEKVRHIAPRVAWEFAGHVHRPPNRTAAETPTLSEEEARFHLDSLAGAIEAGGPEILRSHFEWAAGVLASRNFSAEIVTDCIAYAQHALQPYLSDAERDWLDRFLTDSREVVLHAPPPPETPQFVTEAIRRAFLEAALRGERRAALDISSRALQDGWPVERAYVELFQAALYETGELWAASKIAVGEEHMATAVVQSILPISRRNLPAPETVRGRAVIAAVENETHTMGAAMLADMLEVHGWDVRFLGASVPHPDVIRVVQQHRASVLGVSCTTLMNIPSTVELIRRVRRDVAEFRPHVIVGGGIFRANPALWSVIGADGFASDLPAALTLLRESRWQTPAA